MSPGIFTISLDMELFWGLRDVCRLDDARERLLGDRLVVPRLLDLFASLDIHATWAVVGFLFFEDRDALLAGLPERRPSYSDPLLDPYSALSSIGRNESDDPFHFAPSLIRAIASYPNQEIGTHTLSHYYCLEDGQNEATFEADLRAAIAAAATFKIDLRSLIFPRNQVNPRYLPICRKLGILAYRGNPPTWMYRQRSGPESSLRRGARLVDAYLPLSGTQGIWPPKDASRVPIDVPASRFLRPWTRPLSRLVPLQLRRIKREMTLAARGGRLYHLWWHPHNFGLDSTQNLEITRELIEHFKLLSREHGMLSLHMSEVAARWAPHASAA